MNVSLTPQLEQFVRDLAASGNYNNSSEVIREALRLLQHREEERQSKLDALRAMVREGEEAIERGQYETYDETNIDKMFENAGW